MPYALRLYFVEGADHEDKKYKFSSKGIQKDKNDITKERFEKVLTDQNYKDVCTNIVVLELLIII